MQIHLSVSVSNILCGFDLKNKSTSSSATLASSVIAILIAQIPCYV
jgi:hypothetical protein